MVKPHALNVSDSGSTPGQPTLHQILSRGVIGNISDSESEDAKFNPGSNPGETAKKLGEVHRLRFQIPCGMPEGLLKQTDYSPVV